MMSKRADELESLLEGASPSGIDEKGCHLVGQRAADLETRHGQGQHPVKDQGPAHAQIDADQVGNVLVDHPLVKNGDQAEDCRAQQG